MYVKFKFRLRQEFLSLTHFDLYDSSKTSKMSIDMSEQNGFSFSRKLAFKNIQLDGIFQDSSN